MRAYLAVIRDSFREAFASRILWLLLILITVVLLALVPLSYREELTTGLRDGDVRDWAQFLDRIRTDGKREKKSPARWIWTHFEPELQGKLTRVKIIGREENTGSPFEFINAIRDFRRGISKALEKEDFYSADEWGETPVLTDEGKELLRRSKAKDDSLTAVERQRLHRLLLESAFPDDLRVSAPTSIRFTYVGMDLGPPQPVNGARFADMIAQLVAWLMKWFVGAFGVFVAILVTAPVIPQMFDQGALHLLLSKPISRWLLFLAKYVGGCAFILVSASYLIGGIWLILGVRFGLWNPRLLWSIPIYLFVFAIYYSVAALAGVIWRSPIVSIAVSLMFWLVCFVVGTAKVTVENNVLNKIRIAQTIPGGSAPLASVSPDADTATVKDAGPDGNLPATENTANSGDALFAVNEMGICHVWDASTSKWKEAFVTGDQKQLLPAYYMMPAIPRELKMIGPVYRAADDQLIGVMRNLQRGKLTIVQGRRGEGWEANPVTAAAPMGTFDLLNEADGKLLAISALGIYRLQGDLQIPTEPVKVLGMTIPLSNLGPFVSVGPDPQLVLTQPAQVVTDPGSTRLAACSRGTVTVLEPGARQKYQRVGERKLDGEPSQAVLLALNRSALLLGRNDGRLQLLDTQTLEPKFEYQPEGKNQPRALAASPNGKWFAALFHTGNAYLCDAETGTWQRARVSGQGSISSVGFNSADELYVTDRIDRVTVYDVSAGKSVRSYAPAPSFLQRAYYYALLPVYTVFPKPGELDKTFQFLLSGKTTAGDDSAQNDLASTQRQLHPWAPVTSGLVFTVLMLVAACIYLEFQDL